MTREGYHLDPSHTCEKDYEFPTKETLSFDNQIVGFIHNPKGWKGMNVIMSDGSKSQLPMGANYSEVKVQPEGAIVKRIVVFGNHEFGGVEFYDRNGTKILGAGYHEPSQLKREMSLADGERLIGIRSKLQNNRSPRHLDLQFVIGRLD